MNIVHINFSDCNGGAAIAAYRHCESFNRVGLNSIILSVENISRNSFSCSIGSNHRNVKLCNFITRIISKLIIKPFKPYANFSIMMFGFNICNHPAIKQADVIYLHWVNANTLSIRGIRKILNMGKPVFWYMHDMNPITGGCHHSFNCDKYKKECFKCPLLKGIHVIDIARWQFVKKHKQWSKYSNLKVVTPSKWLAECAKRSNIFQGHDVYVSPNIIDTDKFRLIDKKTAKDFIGIKSKKKIILFCADAIDNPYKGWVYMKNALNSLNEDQYCCLVLGSIHNNSICDVNVDLYYLGHLKDEYSLILAYNAADVFVTSSIAENYPNVILEAMSCGLPSVGFNIGGIPDLIKHKETGYLANYKDSKDLAEGIKWILDDPNRYDILSKKCRNQILLNNSYNNTMTIHSELKQVHNIV